MSQIAAIVLAAGRSSRMGHFKPAMEIAGKAMIARVVDEIQASRAVSSTLVVTGFKSEKIRDLLGQSATFIRNPDFEQGMVTSVQKGAQSLPRCDAFFVVLGDQPGVQAKTYRTILAAWEKDRSKIVIPTYQSKRGHPVLFPVQLKDEIAALAHDDTLKTIVERNDSVTIGIDDPGIVMDVDTPAEFEQERRRLEG